MAEALGLAASVIAVVDLFAKIGVLCSHYCADLKGARREVRGILNEADSFSHTLGDVEKLLSSPNGSKINPINIQRTIDDCRVLLGDLAVKLQQGTRWQWMKWPLKKEEVTQILQKLARWRAAIALELQINQV